MVGTYELKVWGGSHIEQTTDVFDTLEDALMEAELRCTDDTTGWEKEGDALVQGDRNHSDGTADTAILRVRKLS